MSQYEQGSTVPKRTWDGGASDDYLYVGKRDGRYLIVRRDMRRIRLQEFDEPGDAVLSSVTKASSAVLEAVRIDAHQAWPRTVVVSPKVRKELGW